MLSAFRTYMRGNVDKLALQDAGRVVGPALAEQILGSWSQAPDVPLLPSPVLPAEPSVLYLALLGPGGIGKTAILLAIRDHALVAQKYGDCRYFVRCEQATSTTLLVELIARSPRLETSSSDRMKDVMTLLRKADHPILLIVDNFETPRDVEGEQSRVEEMLCEIVSCRHVSVLITMRAHAPRSSTIPCSNRGLHNFVSFRLKPYGDVYIKNPSKIRGQQVPRRVARRALLQAFGYYAHGRSRKTRYNADGALEGVEG
ncbi:hypothetical protein FRB96_005314 [Tulasnella sp. 330]|nr:hypothetical protein FRB96_005314 [Tulasnella sp. 330]